MLDDNNIKLAALSYAEKNKIVNSKTIKAIEFGFKEGYATFNRKDCINRLKAYFENQITEHEMYLAHTGKSNINKELMQKNLELINKIEL